MRKACLVLILAVMMLCVGEYVHAEKGPLGNDCVVPGLYVSGFDLMEALFGNFYSGIQVSTLDPVLAADPEIKQWAMTAPINEMLDDWDELDPDIQDEFLAVQGKIPIRYLAHYRFPNNRMLLAFEAGQWVFESSMWGGANFTGSHNLGMAAFTLVSDGWKLTGYDLNLGRFGAYCITTMSADAVRIGANEYGVMTLDYGRGLFTIMDGDPVLLLRIPHFHGYGHGDPESFDSVVSFEQSGKQYYDLVVETSGENLETGEVLHFFRRWMWGAAIERYMLMESDGNVQNILNDPDYWLLDDF